ncbi:MAG: outer membrane beta-barrel protein [Bacteroidetes bacterium]|nr:outer membrane beta-barrel protein [Bacteroidota bacterium]
MKTTRKIGVVTALLVSLAFASQAQEQPKSTASDKQEFRLSVGPEVGVPIGQFSNNYGWFLGGSVQGELPVAKNLYVLLNAGYNNFFVKDGKVIDQDVRTIPVKAGLKYFFVPNFLYVSAEAGASFLVNKSDLNADKSTAFTYAPQVGVLFPLGSKNYLDVGFRFQGQGSFANNGTYSNFLGLRIAYTFGL